MKKIPSLFFLLATASAMAQQSTTARTLDSIVKKIGDKFIRVPGATGLSIGVYNNGNVSYYNFGTTEKGKDERPTENTVYEIASITKTFAGYLLANAVLEGKVKLTDDIRKFIDGSYPNLEFAGKSIQLVHLANTTSGIPDDITPLPETIKKAPADSIAALEARFYDGLDRKDFFKSLHEVKLDTIPGFRAKHSNAAAELLAYVLEKIYKKPFEQLVQQYVLKPGGMEHSFFGLPGSLLHLVAQGYDDKGLPVAPEFLTPYSRSCAGLRSSAADLVKYIQLQLDPVNKVINLDHQRTIDVNAQTGKSSGLLPDSLVNENVYSICLNWLRYQPQPKGTQLWADGGSHGFNSYLIFYPELNSGIVLLTNKSDEKTFRALPGMADEISQLLGK